LQAEDLWQHLEAFVGVAGVHEELLHAGLPSGVHLGACHRGLGGVVVVGLEVPHQQAVRAEVEAVVAPSGVSQRLEHLRPDGRVRGGVLLEPVRADPVDEAVAGHQPILSFAAAGAGGAGVPGAAGPAGGQASVSVRSAPRSSSAIGTGWPLTREAFPAIPTLTARTPSSTPAARPSGSGAPSGSNTSLSRMASPPP